MLLAFTLEGSMSRLTPCLILSGLVLPCLAVPCLALPCPALPCPALPCVLRLASPILAFQGTRRDKDQGKSKPKRIPAITTLLLQFCRTDSHALASAFCLHLYLCTSACPHFCPSRHSPSVICPSRYELYSGVRVYPYTVTYTAWIIETPITCILALQGLKHHIEASHDLFDFTYTQRGAGVVPTVTVRCPGGLYDRQGRLQNPEAGDIGRGSDCKVSAFSTSYLKLSWSCSGLWA